MSQPSTIQAIQVVTTVGNRAEAERIAAQLVGERLAACVQIVGPVKSTFHWQGAIEVSEEWFCLAKTTLDRYEAIERQIRALHSYELPEIIALPIVAGSPEYLAWIARDVGSEGVSADVAQSNRE
jgi:periplasmic divalent cation tolerance protein